MTNNSQYSIFNIQQRPRREFANSSTRKGFTLIETMVALSILLVSVVGPISLIANSLQNIYYARDQMIAVNLAQEGIEVVRHVRDSNILAGDPVWNPELTPGDYIIDVAILANAGDPEDFVSKCVGGCTPIKKAVVIDPAIGLYRQGFTPSSVTQFSRIVTIDNTGPDERKITSTVTWNTGNKAGTITVNEYLFEMPPL